MANQIVVITQAEENPQLTLEEVCHLYGIPEEFIHEIIAQGIIEPENTSHKELKFNEQHLKRIRIMVHLHRDLEVNTAGGALVIEMMEEMERMHQRLVVLEKFFLK